MNNASIRAHLSLTLVTLVAAAGCGTQLSPAVVQVSGRAMELVETGSGPATVVFEAGFGNDWSCWDEIASAVAKDARVFAYSRPGYGQSAPTTDPRDAAHIVEGLRSLLQARGYAPPYVLVGHSFGGTYMELFAKSYPAEVAGLVLVDPRHRDFTSTCEGQGFTGCGIPAEAVATLPPVQIAEYQAFAQSAAEIASAGSFGTYPVRVLTAEVHGFAPAVESLWVSMLAKLAEEAKDGDQILFHGANHNLELNHAAEVAKVIVGLLPR
ncbi:MAG: alpha/beta hydrolase [Myxococcota bacterium]